MVGRKLDGFYFIYLDLGYTEQGSDFKQCLSKNGVRIMALNVTFNNTSVYFYLVYGFDF